MIHLYIDRTTQHVFFTAAINLSIEGAFSDVVHVRHSGMMPSAAANFNADTCFNWTYVGGRLSMAASDQLGETALLRNQQLKLIYRLHELINAVRYPHGKNLLGQDSVYSLKLAEAQLYLERKGTPGPMLAAEAAIGKVAPEIIALNIVRAANTAKSIMITTENARRRLTTAIASATTVAQVQAVAAEVTRATLMSA